MKKAFILLILIALSAGAYSCGGGGAGGLATPPGSNPGVASVVQLTPEHWIAQTNAFITFRAKVLDGNGAPVANAKVDFTNLSSVGTFQAASIQSAGKTANATTSAYTDGSGIASIRVFSTTSGFVTVLAQVYIGSGNVRDQKTVFFTTNDVLAVSMRLDVDADNDLIYDEPSDVLLGETSTDTSVKIRARVYNAGGVLLAGAQVQIAAERAYRVGNSEIGAGSACSDGSTTCWIAFPLGNTAYTNENGEAVFQMVVGAESLRDFTTNLNIFGSADNGATNMKTLFISPVTVSSITVIANPAVLSPSTLDSPKTSTITATALTNFNQFVPDGTAINFSIDPACEAAGGKITPFARTTNGVATATFTAPSALMTCTVTASVGSLSASTDILITRALTVIPSAVTVNGVTGGTATFTIYGGIPAYTILRDNSAAWSAPVPATVTASGGSFTVTVPPGTAATTVTYTIRDSVGTTVTATLTIVNATALAVFPTSATIEVGGTATFTVFNGVPPYAILSSNTAVATVAPASVAASGGTFTVTGVSAGTATIRVTDTVGTVVTAAITVTPPPPPPDFTLSCAPTNVNGVTTSTCTLTAVNGYIGVVTLSCSPVDPIPVGSSCGFVPNSFALIGTADITLTFTCGPAGGPVFFFVVASDGTLTHSQVMGATCP